MISKMINQTKVHIYKFFDKINRILEQIGKISKPKQIIQAITKPGNITNSKIFDFFPKSEKIEKLEEKPKKMLGGRPKKDVCPSGLKGSLLNFGFKVVDSQKKDIEPLKINFENEVFNFFFFYFSFINLKNENPNENKDDNIIWVGLSSNSQEFIKQIKTLLLNEKY